MSAADLEALDQQLEVQKEAVRKLKANKAPKDQVDAAVALLKDLKTRVEALEVTTKKAKFDRGAFEEVMRRRFFFNQGFEIYNGVAGLYDYGPPGCALKNHWCALWRDHFAIEDGLLEIDCTCVTPEPVLKASGHVDKFTDLMVKDTVTGDCFRADKLLGEVRACAQRLAYCEPADGNNSFGFRSLKACLRTASCPLISALTWRSSAAPSTPCRLLKSRRT